MLCIKIEQSQDFEEILDKLSKEELESELQWLYTQSDIWLGLTTEVYLDDERLM